MHPTLRGRRLTLGVLRLLLRCATLPQEICGNWTLQWTTAATVISIAFFNFFGE